MPISNTYLNVGKRFGFHCMKWEKNKHWCWKRCWQTILHIERVPFSSFNLNFIYSTKLRQVDVGLKHTIYTYPILTHPTPIEVKQSQNTTIDDVLKAKVSNTRCFSICFKHWTLYNLLNGMATTESFPL